ncbi:MAG: DUF2130 domain-containing protein [Sphingobacteriales bacterium]|nr:MAG: DUF2130 domain-containing protein [Sphingobacteriales bacterium]
MSTTIVCPSCTTQFELTSAIRDEITKELRQKWIDAQKKKEDEFRQREDVLLQKQQNLDAELKRRLDAEKKTLEQNLSAELKKNIAEEYDTQLKHFQRMLADKDEKIKTAQQLEIAYLEIKEKLAQQEQELELRLKRSLLEERERLQEILRKEENERSKLKDQEHFMKIKELEKQLEDQRLLAEEMKRKAEQGSMQLQGEVQELLLEALLRSSFPFDMVNEVGKGVRGADCIQTVRNSFGQECGKIIYESKRTKDFSSEWIEKLKADMRNLGADVAVIVTQAMPKDMDCFGEKDGVWICSFSEVRALTSVLRDLIIRVHVAAKNQENKGDKMTLLYNYLTSQEFSEQWKAIREGFMSMKMSIQRERDQMEKLWKAREKQLEKVLLNAAHIKGSIEGISGMDNVDLNLINEEPSYLIE